jgi:Lysyl oxidase
LALRSVQLRRGIPLLAILALLLLVGAARAQAAVELLPDLVEQTPANVKADSTGLTFDSQVINRGNGPLTIHGHRPSNNGQNMTADQIVNLVGGGTETVAGIGQLHYETSFGHQHWHFMPFNHYELHKLDGTLVGTDVKQGFCLGDNDSEGGLNRVFTDWCRQNHPEETNVTEGLSVGFGDTYEAGLELQYVPINPTDVPTGDYQLVHRVNQNADGSHPVKETNYSNNAASVEVHITWTGNSPKANVIKKCPGTAVCGGTTAPPPTQPPPTQPPPTLPPAYVPPHDSIAPKLTFSRSTTLHFTSRTAAVVLSTTCNEECRVTAQGTISFLSAARALRTGVTTMTLPPSQRAKMVLTLSRKTRKAIRHALARHKRVRVKVKLTVLDEAGNKTVSTRTLKLIR